MTQEELEKKLKKVYERASKETTKKLDDYLKQFERLDKKWQAEVKAGTKTVEEYQKWRVGKVAMGERWRTVRDSLAQDVVNADNIARDMINGYLPEVYAEGINYASYQIASTIGLKASVNSAFSIYNKDAIEHLVKNNPNLLPQLKEESKTAKAIREGKIARWSRQKINAEVTQGILQGESMPKIAKRMQNVCGMEKNSAIRNARTATNGAFNAGKVQGYSRAEDIGIEVEQEWLACLDDRTRSEHRQLDGQTVKVGEDFEVDGFRIAYPCDPTAAPEMVYNCRCTLIPYLPKYSKKLTTKDRNTDKLNDKSYIEWKTSQPKYEEEKELEKETR